MEEEIYRFAVGLAGLRVGITTRSPQVRAFFRDYILPEDGEPEDLSVQAGPEQLEEERRTAEAMGQRFGDAYLERLALYRCIAEQAPARDILLMHGSVIAVDGIAYMFTAPSGTGKSTHARLWREAFGERTVMVNDDKPLLICREDGIYACGTPWNGKHGLSSNVILPLRAIAVLNRGEENRCEPVLPENYFEFLYTQIFRPTAPQMQLRSLQLIGRLCAQTKIYDLRCNMEPEAAEIAYAAMRQSKGENRP